MDSADLAQYVGAPDTDTTFVGQCWDESVALVNAYIEGSTVVNTGAQSLTEVVDPLTGDVLNNVSMLPAEVVDRAYLEVGSELYHRRNAPNGIAQFSSFDGNAMRVARDPMVAAYPLLQRYLVVGF